MKRIDRFFLAVGFVAAAYLFAHFLASQGVACPTGEPAAAMVTILVVAIERRHGPELEIYDYRGLDGYLRR